MKDIVKVKNQRKKKCINLYRWLEKKLDNLEMYMIIGNNKLIN